MNKITTVGVDLAKEVIVVCGADAGGHVVFRKQLSFASLPDLFKPSIQKMSGVGVITASALVATIASPNDFQNGRVLSVRWPGKYQFN